MNKVMLLGNLGADAELTVLESGSSVLKFSLATTESWKDSEGNKKERTEWSRCALFGKRADSLAQWLTKGKKILVEGKLRTDSYDKDGEKRYSTSIIVDNVEFVGGGRSESSETSSEDSTTTVPTKPALDSDEIPF